MILLRNNQQFNSQLRLIGQLNRIQKREFSILSNLTLKLEEKRKQQQFQIEQNKQKDILVSNIGANQFLQRVYKTSGFSIFGALSTSQLIISSGILISTSNILLILGGFVSTIVGFGCTLFMSPKLISYQEKDVVVHKTSNSIFRLGFYSLGVFGLGLSASPIFYMIQKINPTIIPYSCAISAMIFGAASLIAYQQPKEQVLSWDLILGYPLLGLLFFQFTGYISLKAMGPNQLSDFCHRIDIFGGLAIFSVIVAYDTHLALKNYEEGFADHLGTSIQLVTDFWNILLRVVEMLRMFSYSQNDQSGGNLSDDDGDGDGGDGD